MSRTTKEYGRDWMAGFSLFRIMNNSTIQSAERYAGPLRRARSILTAMLTVSVAILMAAQNPIRLIDLDRDSKRQTVVDRQEGQYLGHISTVLLRDGRTILAVYPQGHGKGQITYKRSADGGQTWSGRLPTPGNWSTSLETPTIHRVIDPKTKKERLILWSGLYPARLATSADDGKSWTELKQVGNWGGIVVMGFVERLKAATT